MQDDSKKTFNRKVIDLDEIYNFALLIKSWKCLDFEL